MILDYTKKVWLTAAVNTVTHHNYRDYYYYSNSTVATTEDEDETRSALQRHRGASDDRNR